MFSFITLLSLASPSSVRAESVEDMCHVFELCVRQSDINTERCLILYLMLFFRSVREFGGVQTGCC